MRMYSPVITNVETPEPVVALTFDDGPHPVYTQRVLEVLKKHGAKATFFMIGESARKHPHVVRQVAEGGHAIGNHTWTHVNLTKVGSRIERLRLMRSGAKEIEPFCLRLFRPPYGAHNKKILLDAFILRCKTILWSASAQDWILQEPEEIAQKIITRVSGGDIFLLHDAIIDRKEPTEITDRGFMIEGLDSALSCLKSKMRFETLPVLLKAGRPVSKWPLNTPATKPAMNA
jgi:peptidoglycan-N-acetylglucosamine deacetylase